MQHLQEDGSYNQLYPKSDSYSKNETLTNNTSQMFRIDNGTPEDVFKWLRKYNQYWWRRVKTNIVYSVQVAQTSTDAIFAVYYVDGNHNTIYYSDEVYADKNGVHLKNPKSISIWVGSAGESAAQTLYHKYVTNCYNGYETNATKTNDVMYIDGDIYWYSNMNYTGSSDGRYICSPTSSEVQGDIEYVYSANRSEYPDFGKSGEYTYEFLGTPFSNIKEFTKNQIGTYQGTGTHGSNNLNSLNFNFVPKIVMVARDSQWGFEDYDGFFYIGQKGQESARIFSLSNNILSWYSTVDNRRQCNIQGTLYYYVAFG